MDILGILFVAAGMGLLVLLTGFLPMWIEDALHERKCRQVDAERREREGSL